MNKIVYADSFMKRLMGLMFKESFEDVMVFSNLTSASIHTCFMNFTIDVYFLDENKKIIDKVTLKPWRYYRCKLKATYIAETEHGKLKLKTGDVLEFL